MSSSLLRHSGSAAMMASISRHRVRGTDFILCRSYVANHAVDDDTQTVVVKS